MAENIAAKIDENGDVIEAIVIPPGENAEAYCPSLGLPGAWLGGAPGNCPGWRHHEGGFYPHWQQIAGADTGPEGIESGYPVGFECWKDGAVRVSRVPNNVNEPLDGVATTWSRKDGAYVTPAGWEYQPGEEVLEGGTWYRVKQATSFAPSESPGQFDQIDGPGGEPVAPGNEWAAGTTYTTGDEVTYQSTTYRCIQGHTAIVGWHPPAVPNLWEVV